MKWGKFIAAAAVAAIVRFIIDGAFRVGFGHLYDHVTGLYRAFGTPDFIQGLLLWHVVAAIIAVGGYIAVNRSLGRVKQVARKGAYYGLLLFAVRDLSAAAMIYALLPLPPSAVGVWLLAGLVSAMINGQLIARIYR